MQIFIDSADWTEIAKWFEQGVVDGVTTNPSIMLKSGIHDIESGSRQLADSLGKLPLSVEVTTNDPAQMLEQARQLASWAPNIVVKIPVINADGDSCLGVINTLFRERISVNATAMLSFGQSMLAAKAGARYLSIFWGRVADEGNDPAAVVRNVRQWLDEWGSTAQIIVGSIRSVIDIQNAALSRAHVITIPPQFLPKLVDHQYTRETVRQFNRDAEKAMLGIGRAAAAAAGRPR